MSDLSAVLAAALRLPAEARAAVAAELLESLEGPREGDADIERLWADETARRLAEVDAGAVTTVPWSEARWRIAAAAGGRRETP
jgi:hypothetical protein